MMAQIEDINKYLSDDTIFNKISKHFISLDSDYKRRNNELLTPILNKLIDAMRKQNPLFDTTFQRIMWVGSYYKGTRFGQPEEYDLNFVINLPIKERDVEFHIADRPGFIKIRTAWRDRYSQNTLNLSPKAYRELNSFFDEQSYLNQVKFRTWMEGIFSKVANATSGNNIIVFDDYPPIKIKKSGPAFTLIFQVDCGRNIDIDVVPALAFSARILPSRYSKKDIQLNRYWSVVPKPLNNSRGCCFDDLHRYWRLCFYEFEKDMLSSHNYGRMKPVIRQLKKLRDTQDWKSIASYFLETLCYHEKEMFHISQKKSFTFLFFTMLEKLRDAFHNCSIRYYWDDNLNLLENIGSIEMRNMEGRLENVLKNIRKTIKEDQYAIARWVLDGDDLEKLKNLGRVAESEPELQPESESELEISNQWNCVIV